MRTKALRCQFFSFLWEVVSENLNFLCARRSDLTQDPGSRIQDPGVPAAAGSDPGPHKFLRKEEKRKTMPDEKKDRELGKIKKIKIKTEIFSN